MSGVAGVIVRTARPQDIEAVRALLASASLPTMGLDEQFGAAYAVAESGGEVVGAEGIERHGVFGLLRSAVIAPRWRGRGVGEALTRNRLAWAAAEGLDAVYLLTMSAVDWFPRFGFVPVERGSVPKEIALSGEFRDLCPASAVVMRLGLRASSPVTDDSSGSAAGDKVIGKVGLAAGLGEPGPDSMPVTNDR